VILEAAPTNSYEFVILATLPDLKFVNLEAEDWIWEQQMNLSFRQHTATHQYALYHTAACCSVDQQQYEFGSNV